VPTRQEEKNSWTKIFGLTVRGGGSVQKGEGARQEGKKKMEEKGLREVLSSREIRWGRAGELA